MRKNRAIQENLRRRIRDNLKSTFLLNVIIFNTRRANSFSVRQKREQTLNADIDEIASRGKSRARVYTDSVPNQLEALFTTPYNYTLIQNIRKRSFSHRKRVKGVSLSYRFQKCHCPHLSG